MEEMPVRCSLTCLVIVIIISMPLFYGCEVKCEEHCEGKTDCYQTCEIISNLIRESEPFRTFYKAEKNNITSCICWREEPNLPPDFDAITSPSSNITYLRRIPPRIDDSFHDDFIVAHELCVYILKERGFPTLEIKSDVDNQDIQLICGASFNTDNMQLLLNSLSDMTATPLRDSILSKYGFDLENAYEEYTNVLLDQPAPTNDFVLLDNIFLYTRSVLYWENVLHKTQPTGWQEQFFDKKYPDVAKGGEIMLNKIRTIGYDTPEKMSELYLDILNWLHLQDIVEVVRL